MSNAKCRKNAENHINSSAMTQKKTIFATLNTQHPLPPMIIRNSLIPFPNFLAINLFGIIFTRKNVRLSAVDLNHERIHTAQMLETLILGFYLWYLVEWLIRLVIERDPMHAYRAIRFEREAYTHQHLQSQVCHWSKNP